MATETSLLSTENINGNRYYNTEFGKFPSVTTILSAMSDHSYLDDWKKRIGENEAARISKFSSNRGTIYHQFLEWFFTKTKNLDELKSLMDIFVEENNFTKEEYDCGKFLFNNILDFHFPDHVKEIVLQEETLYSKDGGGFAGRVDSIIKNMDDEIIVVDYKTSKRPKKLDQISNYYLQISSYSIAYEQLFNQKVSGAELWISNENGDPQLVRLNRHQIGEYYKIFLTWVERFHNTHQI